ncbi:MAG: DNA-directed RNA polymerase subunit omega, partial [Nitrospirales bacterium]
MIDILSLIPDENYDRFDSRYRLVLAASQRAKHLIQGARTTGASKFSKETTVGLDEVLHGHVEYLTGQEARQAIKESKRGRESEVEPMAVAESVE